MSYLTLDELDAVQSSGLDPFTPYVIQGANFTQFSIAQYFGMCKYGGRDYYYNRATDELIREDVLKWVTKRRKKAQRAGREATDAQQMEML